MRFNRLILQCLMLVLVGVVGFKSHAELSQDIQVKALKYFTENANPATGLVRDLADNFAVSDPSNKRASLAATGFGLAVQVNAAQLGLESDEEARAYALKTLRFVRDHVDRHAGWLIHFVDWNTGERFGDSEYSTIDTALFLAGALYAGRVYRGTEIERLANELYRECDFWDIMTDGGTKPLKRTLSLSYRPETGGYSPHQWNAYAEEMLLFVLGLGHPTHPLPMEVWQNWTRQFKVESDGYKLIGYDKPLFTHQYTQLFIDFRNLKDQGTDYFENGLKASLDNRGVCLADHEHATYKAGFWGLSAGASPQGYSVFNPLKKDTIVCTGCAAASIMFSPALVLGDIQNWLSGPFGKEIWGRYGLVDSLDIDHHWFAQNAYGITVGPEFLSVSNLSHEHSVWQVFNEIPEIKRALERIKSGALVAELAP